LLILKSEDFQANPRKVFSRVLDFLDIEVPAVREYEMSSIEDYSNMPRAIEQELVSYFEPYNRELSDLLKEDFSWS
jgi:hypothetical protein